LRKKRNPRFHARARLHKEEDMTVEDEKPEEAGKGTEPETGAGF
jgi:hypothetical protein